MARRQLYGGREADELRLGPRDQWGEETGEHLADILRIQ